MKKINYILFVFILLALIIPQKAYPLDKVKTVVVFFALDVNLPAYRTFMEGFNGHYSEVPDQPFNVIIEYMGINRYPHDEDIESVVGQYCEKYDAIDIDLLVTFGPSTFSVLKKYGFGPINTSPVVNIDIESNIYSENGEPLFANENALHISIKTNYGETLKTAFDLFPDYKDVYIISGSSPADRYFAELTRQATEPFNESHNFTFYNGFSFDSTLSLVRKIPQSSIVFTTSFLEDLNKVPFSTSMVVRIFSKECIAPHFTLSDDFIEEGLIGGYVYSFIELGKHTENIVEEVLNGRSIKEITVDENSFNKHMYSWPMLKKWNLLDSKAINSDSIILNNEVNFFKRYQWSILGVFIFIISQAILIMYLIRLNKKQKGVARQHTENEQLFREMTREDRLSRMSELTASLSHELNQPLTAILYNAQAGKRFIASGKLDDEQAAEIFEQYYRR